MVCRNIEGHCGVISGKWFVGPLALLLLCGGCSCDSEPPAGATKATKGASPSESGTSIQDKSAASRPKYSSPSILFEAPQFKLTDQTGESFGTDDLRGAVWVANFMFTECRTTGLQQTARFAKLQLHARRWPDWK